MNHIPYAIALTRQNDLLREAAAARTRTTPRRISFLRFRGHLKSQH